MNEPGNPNPPPLPESASRPTGGAGGDARYDRVANTIGLVPNFRKRDNLYQGICVVLCTMAGAAWGRWAWDGDQIRNIVGDEPGMRTLIGGAAGLVLGALVSGLVLLVLGLKRKG